MATRNSIIELDDSASAVASSPATQTVKPNVAEVQQQWALKNGYAPARTFFSLGTDLISVGEDDLKRSRAEWEKLPDLRDGMEKFAATIDAEHRRDVDCKVNDLAMLPDGTISRGGPPVAIEQRAFESLMRRVPGAAYGAAAYLSACPVPLRPEHATHWFKKANPGAEVKLRLRNGTGPGRIWGVVSPSYGEIDANRLARSLKTALPATAKVDVAYDGYRSTINVLWHDQSLVGEHKVGCFSKVGVVVTTADDGTSSVRVSGILYETLCVNLSTVPVLKKFDRTVHRGRRGTTNGHLTERIETHVEAAVKSIGPFLEAWSEAEKVRIMESDEDPPKVFGRLIDRGYIDVAGIKRDDLVSRLMTAYHKQPGWSRTSIIQAVTRTAHTAAWSSPWTTDTMQEQAGKLLYVNVRNFQEDVQPEQ